MLTMMLKRAAMAIPSLIGVVIVTFLLTRALPGDPAVYFAGPAATPQAIQEVRVKLGLDKPLIAQFGRYVVDLAFADIPRIPLLQPYSNVAMQKNVSGYQYWFHRRLDYRALAKG